MVAESRGHTQDAIECSSSRALILGVLLTSRERCVLTHSIANHTGAGQPSSLRSGILGSPKKQCHISSIGLLKKGEKLLSGFFVWASATVAPHTILLAVNPLHEVLLIGFRKLSKMTQTQVIDEKLVDRLEQHASSLRKGYCRVTSDFYSNGLIHSGNMYSNRMLAENSVGYATRFLKLIHMGAYGEERLLVVQDQLFDHLGTQCKGVLANRCVNAKAKADQECITISSSDNTKRLVGQYLVSGSLRTRLCLVLLLLLLLTLQTSFVPGGVPFRPLIQVKADRKDLLVQESMLNVEVHVLGNKTPKSTGLETERSEFTILLKVLHDLRHNRSAQGCLRRRRESGTSGSGLWCTQRQRGPKARARAKQERSQSSSCIHWFACTEIMDRADVLLVDDDITRIHTGGRSPLEGLGVVEAGHTVGWPKFVVESERRASELTVHTAVE
mmetsp:Transcript_15811/g.47462  ORF Transcript_15811/g.47462 Transcript_15811/m.47462 type:complete len:443 (+) Transcript_15811:767-2095(+)